MASSFRTVNAVWTMYAALYQHLTEASRDAGRTSTERCMYEGLARKLRSVAFLKNLGLMMDALEELKDLSEALQCRDIRLSQSVHLIKRQVDVFKSMSSNPELGPFYKQACEAEQVGSFHGVTLQRDNREKEIDPNQFYEALFEGMQTRMVTVQEESLFNKINILDKTTWPNPLPLMYGENEVRELCDFLNIGFAGMKQGYRDFKDNPSIIPKSLVTLKQAIDTIAVSSAECERGFSEMNNVVTPLRSKLNTGNVSALMFIKIVGPPINSWDPTKFVKKWVATRRSADHLACKKRCTVTEVSPYQPIWDLMK